MRSQLIKRQQFHGNPPPLYLSWLTDKLFNYLCPAQRTGVFQDNFYLYSFFFRT